MKITLAHHWLVAMRGGEKVLEEFSRLFPAATVATLVADSAQLTPALRRHPLKTSVLQRVPFAAKAYRSLLPFHPSAISRLKVDADFVLSSDASLIKGLQYAPGVPHVCYCHSPPRYIWEMSDAYAARQKSLRSVQDLVLQQVLPGLKRFDYDAAKRVTHFIANSEFVRARIRRYYDRDASVVYPPVDVDAFDFGARRQDAFLVVSQLVPYKRVDLAVKAFNRNGKPLVIIGDGSERKYLQSIAKPNIKFLGRQPFDVLRAHYESCRGFVFPGIEDFGITPLEAQSAGCPVVAFRAGGALETVVEGETGVFFDRQEVDSLVEAVDRFEDELRGFLPEACRANAERFRPEVFRNRLRQELQRVCPKLDLSPDRESQLV